ncbi:MULTISPECIES: acyltransferase [unclassified Acinetobacter]|uniref:acyltransferase family protein n=1 Tax=unclassified Acinetobacter TaxID=196816 RepID=UPI00293516E9|nr:MULTISPECIES: acyltransferase [unclassified Acinetobacter]WOE33233.1 acyltransferase [Acinetobacter sp. SAAs470]WOE36986.1 acyltransferase [Acinetobacter sp. SAAs474]
MSFRDTIFERNEFIDMLRFLSISLVLLHHFNIPYKLFETFLTFNIFNESFITMLSRNGNYGVTMFFVISGYLITSHSIKRWNGIQNINFKNFYISRIARIIPTLLLVVLIVNFLGLLDLKPFMTQAPNGIIVSQSTVNFAALTFWMNILIINNGWVNYALGVLWSLSVEEVFYLLFPISAILFKKEHFFIFLCITLIIYCPYFRHLNYGNDNGAYLYHYFSSFDGIAYGCLAAIISSHYKFKISVSQCIKYLMIVIMTAIYFYGPIKETAVWGISFFALCTSILIMTSISINKKYPKNIILNFCKQTGRNSYEIYLFHLIILGFIKILYVPSETFGNIKVLLLIIYFTLTFILGYFIEKYFSNPLNMKIRNYFIKK